MRKFLLTFAALVLMVGAGQAEARPCGQGFLTDLGITTGNTGLAEGVTAGAATVASTYAVNAAGSDIGGAPMPAYLFLTLAGFVKCDIDNGGLTRKLAEVVTPVYVAHASPFYSDSLKPAMLATVEDIGAKERARLVAEFAATQRPHSVMVAAK